MMGPLGNMWARVPTGELSENAKLVLWSLLSCFEKAGDVREGLVKDVLWGFQVSGHEPEKVAYGLVDLKRAGFVGFETPDGVETDEHCSHLADCWLTYKPRLLDVLYM